MTFRWNLYSTLDIVAAAIQLVLAVVAFRRRGVPGATPLALVMLSGAEWAIGGALEYAAVGTAHKVFWAVIEYIGSSSMAVFLLMLAIEYNRLERLLTRRNIAVLFIVPVTAMLLAATNNWHHLIWTHFDKDPLHSEILEYRHGFAFWICVVAYSYILDITATALFVWAAIRLSSFYRRQTFLLLLGTLIPWAGDFLYDMKALSLPGLELGPIGMSVTGVVLTVAIFRFGLLDIIPVARDTLVETLHDGILVLDNLDRVVDINPAARKLLKATPGVAADPQLGETLSPWPTVLAGIRDEWDTGVAPSAPLIDPAHIEITVAPVKNRRGALTARLIILHDVSVRDAAEREIRRTNELLRAQIEANVALQEELKELAIRDPLTGLFNRRHMDSVLEAQIAQAQAGGQSMAVVMLDVDYFKKLNDTYGHKVGDAALQQLGDLLRRQIGATHTACRFGGEEFVVLMPGANAADGLHLAEAIRCEFENLAIQYDGKTVHRTLSAGVAVYPEDAGDAEALLQAGDLALYAAKKAGRNCVMRAVRYVRQSVGTWETR